MDASTDLTELIHRAQAGDPGAAEALFQATYPELRRLARARLRAGGRGTLLDTSSLVHEWYVRFLERGQVRLEDRAHFMSYAGRAMRSVIIDFARRRLAARRGGGAARESLSVRLVDGAALAGEEQILRATRPSRSSPGWSRGWPRWWSCGTSWGSPSRRSPAPWA